MVKATGKKAPAMLGGTTAEAVAAAIETAIHKAPPEMIINFPWLRPIFLFRDMFPRIGEAVFLGVTLRFLKRVAMFGRQKQ